MTAREEAWGGNDDARIGQRGCSHVRKEDGVGRQERCQGAEADAETAVVAGVRAALEVWLSLYVKVLMFRMLMRRRLVCADRRVTLAAGCRMVGRRASHDGGHRASRGQQERKQQDEQDAELSHGRILSRLSEHSFKALLVCSTGAAGQVERSA